MRHLSVFRVIASTTVAAVAIGVVFLYANPPTDQVGTTFLKISAVEESAKNRFSESGGLTPCEHEDRRVVEAAVRKLNLAGQPVPPLMVVVTPTFSDIHILAFGPEQLDRYEFPEQTGFASEFTDGDHVEPESLRQVRLPQDTYQRLIAAMSRNTEYAMSAREYGHDGVSYYFKSGADLCAMTWSPSPDTIGGTITALVDLLMLDQISNPAIQRELDSLDRIELAH